MTRPCDSPCPRAAAASRPQYEQRPLAASTGTVAPHCAGGGGPGVQWTSESQRGGEAAPFHIWRMTRMD